MGVLLAHPGLSRRSCRDCEKWVFENDDSEPRERGGKPIPRRGLPPCNKCPKCDNSKEKSPKAGRLAELSPRNWKTIAAYWEHKGAGGEVRDPITRKNFGLIARIIANHERKTQRGIAISLTGLEARL